SDRLLHPCLRYVATRRGTDLVRGPGRGQAQVLAQGRAGVLGRIHAPLLQARDQVVDDVVQARGDQPGGDVQTVDRAQPCELHEALRDRVVAAGEGAATGPGPCPGELEDRLALLRGLLAPGAGELLRLRELEAGAAGDPGFHHLRRHVRQRAVRVEVGEVPAPVLL